MHSAQQHRWRLVSVLLLLLFTSQLRGAEAAKYNATQIFGCYGCKDNFGSIRSATDGSVYYVGIPEGAFSIFQNGTIRDDYSCLNCFTSLLPANESTIYTSRNHCIYRATTSAGLDENQIIDKVVAGKCDDKNYGNVDGSGDAARFNGPRGLVLSSDSKAIYIADSLNKAVRKMDLATNDVTTVYMRNDYGETRAVAPIDTDNLFIAHPFCIVKHNIASNSTAILAGNCTEAGNSDAASGLSARFADISDMVYSRGKLFIADRNNCAFREIYLNSNGSVWVRSMNDYAPGTNLAYGTTQCPTEFEPQNGWDIQFHNPMGIAPTISGDGMLYVADRNKIFRFDPFIRLDNNNNNSMIPQNQRELVLISNDGDFSPLPENNTVTVFVDSAELPCAVFEASATSISCSFGNDNGILLPVGALIGVRVVSNVVWSTTPAASFAMQIQTSQVEWVATIVEQQPPIVFATTAVYNYNDTTITIHGQRFNTTPDGNHIEAYEASSDAYGGYDEYSLSNATTTTSDYSSGRMLTFTPSFPLIAGAIISVRVTTEAGASAITEIGSIAPVSLPPIGVYVSMQQTNSSISMLLYSPLEAVFSNDNDNQVVKILQAESKFITKPPIACQPESSDGYILICRFNNEAAITTDKTRFLVYYHGVILRDFAPPTSESEMPVASANSANTNISSTDTEVTIHASRLPAGDGAYHVLILQESPQSRLAVLRHLNSSCDLVSDLTLLCSVSGLASGYDVYAYVIDPNGYFSNKVFLGRVTDNRGPGGGDTCSPSEIEQGQSAGCPSLSSYPEAESSSSPMPTEPTFSSSSSSSPLLPPPTAASSTTSTTSTTTEGASSSSSHVPPSQTNAKDAGTSIAVVVVVVVLLVIAIIVIIAIALAAIFLLQRRRRGAARGFNKQRRGNAGLETEMSANYNEHTTKINMQSTSSLQSTGSLASINLDASSFEIDYSELKIEKRIAAGAYGTVYRGKWNMQTVAIKEFRRDTNEVSEEELRKFILEFQNEVALLGNIRHRNVVNFYGASVTPPKYVIVTEFMERGSLHSALHSKKSKIPFTFEQKLALCSQIASAMMFLHKKGIIHRDLKCHNILLDSFLVAKVCDFGLAKSKSTFNAGQRHMTQAVGTPIYMAPEVVKGQSYDCSCDVFSFGIILWEILTERIPYDTVPSHEVAMIHMKVSLEPTFRPELPKIDTKLPQKVQHLQQRYIELLQYCWDADPAVRPSFSEIFGFLSSFEKEMQHHPKT